MVTTTRAHNPDAGGCSSNGASATGRGDALHALAVQLYELISSGHDALAYNVDPRGPALTTVDVDGKRRPARTGGGEGGAAPPRPRARAARRGGGRSALQPLGVGEARARPVLGGAGGAGMGAVGCARATSGRARRAQSRGTRSRRRRLPSRLRVRRRRTPLRGARRELAARASTGSMTVRVVNIRGVFMVVLDPAVMMNV